MSKVSYDKGIWNIYSSRPDSIISLTFDMQIDIVTALMEWMDFFYHTTQLTQYLINV